MSAGYKLSPIVVLSVSSISRQAVTCPSCRGQVSGPVEHCPACAYSADVVVEKFPFAAPALDALIDVEGVAVGEEAGVRAAVGDFAGRFPQLRVVVCILRLSPGTDIRQFGHWMINASPLAGGRLPLIADGPFCCSWTWLPRMPASPWDMISRLSWEKPPPGTRW